MYETLLRPHEVAQIPQPQPIGEISAKLKEAEKRREEKRLRQIANNHARLATAAAVTSGNEAISSTSGAPAKRKRDQDDLKPKEDITAQGLTAGDKLPGTKRIKTGEDEGTGNAEIMTDVAMDTIKPEDTQGDVVADESHQEIKQSAFTSVPGSRLSVSNALPDVRGHTSYLTFAVLVPFTAPVDSLGAVKEDTTTLTTPSEVDKSSIGPS